MSASSRLGRSLGLLAVLLVVGVGSSPAQAPRTTPPSALPDLPRFTLRQIVMRRNDSLMRIPGPWFSAATAMLPESLTTRAYTAASARVGLQPLRGSTLAAERSQHVMGLYRRHELLGASRRTLEAIRSAIRSDTTRARFDRIFRPRGQWIVDLHDAAIAWVHSRAPGLRWEAARPALKGAHWIAADSAPDDEALLRALYGLAVLAANDSVAFAGARARLWDADSTSAAAALMFLQGYNEARRWYEDAIGFFLREPWVPQGPGQSVRDYVRAEWSAALEKSVEPALPHIETRWFGYPQAVPRYGVPAALFQHLVTADNPSGSAWLRQNGEQALLRTLRWLPAGDTSLALLRTASETLRLTTVARQSRENLNGFLEPRDVIAIDPGYSPLLALGAIVHEWQHLLFRRHQLEAFGEAFQASSLRGGVRLPGVQPHLAEGFAEWSSERILGPVTARWPLLGLGELEKRADLVQRGADDQHAIGYALVRALAAAMADPAATTRLLMTHAEHPAGVYATTALQAAWSKHRGAVDRILHGPKYRMLIPQVSFTIEDGFPDVIETRILVPVDNANR